MSSPVVRAATKADEPFLTQMLIVAFNFDGTERTSVDELIAQEVPVYVSGWGRDGDLGVIAEIDGVPVGAAWSRLFDAQAQTYGHVAADIPELVCIGIDAQAQGRGVGRLLFDGLIAQLRDLGYRAVSLSVEDDNARAKAMYERRGFTVVGRNGEADTMLLRLASTHLA